MSQHHYNRVDLLYLHCSNLTQLSSRKKFNLSPFAWPVEPPLLSYLSIPPPSFVCRCVRAFSAAEQNAAQPPEPRNLSQVHEMFLGADDEQGRNINEVVNALRSSGISQKDVS